MIPAALRRFCRLLVRVKGMNDSTEGTRLSRCLDTYDLVALGVGSTLGAGVYVVAGDVAKDISGPAVVLSFLIAALAAIMAGLCYAEFGARVPKTGTAYLYSYVTVGEVLAFITGWNLLTSYVIGTASVAKTWSRTFDTILGNIIETWSKKLIPMNSPNILAEYPDIFAVFIIMVMTGVLSFGVKESAMLSKVFTSINILVLVSVMISGCIKGDVKNWNLNADAIISAAIHNSPNGTDHSELKKSLGAGGFLPFGWQGVFSGAAKCFYAFIGFECITTAGEEAKNPQKTIPISIVTSQLVCFLAYFGVSAALTFMVPFYLLDKHSPLPVAFTHLGWVGVTYAVAVGSLCALSTSLLGAMFPMARVMWAMAQDGLLFKCFSTINERTKTPFVATVTAGVLAAVMALIFNLKDLVDMMAIGALLAYTLVAACVLVLRYQPEGGGAREEGSENGAESDVPTHQRIRIAIFCSGTEPTRASGSVVIVCVSVLVFLVFAFNVTAVAFQLTLWSLCLLVVIMSACLVVVFVICTQPQNKTQLFFKVPMVPFLPVLSMLVNTFLVMQLMKGLWMHYCCCLTLGLIIYFSYGIHHSTQAETQHHS
ncbi:high affinity cationic amino acid transporter 1-like isoform X2 [Nerophis lumbriciformis]|uniref:high affinity cationic amino acid transporter 1-like isoform X2 n=1 Tax=Nerophis lumbriciformis TaxID=546530 RepID=UPI002AE0847E|nr:high affinity cationic amino acid transporter 1-like isoform X2 [Nerophis lumbriciformis]